MTTAKRRSQILNYETDAITAAIRRAVRDAIEEHYRAGVPIVIWRDGKVVEVPPEEIPALLAAGDERVARQSAPVERAVAPHTPAAD
jgi:hypothetical protein